MGEQRAAPPRGAGPRSRGPRRRRRPAATARRRLGRRAVGSMRLRSAGAEGFRGGETPRTGRDWGAYAVAIRRSVSPVMRRAEPGPGVGAPPCLRVGVAAGRGAPEQYHPMLSQGAADFRLLSITEL